MKRLAVFLVAACGGAASADPLPPIGEVAALSLSQQQGGPSAIRCDGIVYDATIDLRAGTWTSAWCMPPAGNDAAGVRRKPKTGKLAKDAREKIVAAYGKLEAMVAPGCGNDGGTLTLTITKADKSTVKLLDENWGCRKPPPMMAKGLPALAAIVAALAPP